MTNPDWFQEHYFVVESGKPVGPFSLLDLQKRSLKGSDFIRTSGMPEFKELREIKELSDLLNVKFEYTQPQYFATLDTRLLAFAIDYFVSFFIYACLVALFLAGDTEDPQSRIPLIIVGMSSVPVFKFIMSILLEGSTMQGTIGKFLIGIQVTDSLGKRINLGHATGRNLAKLVGVFSLGIGFFVGFFDAKQRCWHDRIAGTLVIRKRLI